MSNTPEQPKSKGAEEQADLVLPKELTDSLGELPAAKRGQILRILREEVTQFAFAGPFPPPQMLDDYERHYPGFLKELMDRALVAQSHERQMDQLGLLEPFHYARRGQIFGFLIVVGSFAVTAIGIVFHEPWVAGIASTTGMAPIVGHFLKTQPGFMKREEAIPDQPKAGPPTPKRTGKSSGGNSKSAKART